MNDSHIHDLIREVAAEEGLTVRSFPIRQKLIGFPPAGLKCLVGGEIVWRCQQCQGHNPATETACVACGLARTEPVKR